MPNVTEAEKALLDAVISGETGDGAYERRRALRVAVLMERADSTLFGQAVEALVSQREAEERARATEDEFVRSFSNEDEWDLRAKVREVARARREAK